MSGLIYYVLDATRTSQYVKIGYTENLTQRLVTLRIQTPSRQTPIVLALEEGDQTYESSQHKQFAHLRWAGEWFHYRDEVRDYIAGLDNPVGFLQDQPHLWAAAKGWVGVPDLRLPADARELAYLVDPASARTVAF